MLESSLRHPCIENTAKFALPWYDSHHRRRNRGVWAPDFFLWGAQYDRGPHFWKMPPHLWVKSNALFSELNFILSALQTVHGALWLTAWLSLRLRLSQCRWICAIQWKLKHYRYLYYKWPYIDIYTIQDSRTHYKTASTQTDQSI